MEETEISPIDVDYFHFRNIGSAEVGSKSSPSAEHGTSLLATSSKYGYTLIGKKNYILYVETKSLLEMMSKNKNSPINTSLFTKIPLPEASENSELLAIELSCDELSAVAISSSKAFFFDLRSVAKGVSHN